MVRYRLLILASCLLLTLAAPAFSAGETGEAARILERINGERRAAGLVPLTARPLLEAVAGDRARRALETEDLGLTQPAYYEISRRLRRGGYPPATWSEKVLRTSGGESSGPEVFERWLKTARKDALQLVDGDFEDIGVAVAHRGETTVCSLLLALSRRTSLLRQAAPLRHLEEVRRRLLAAANARRTDAGRTPLSRDPRLDAAAQAFAEELLETRQYRHVDRSGGGPRERVERAGYRRPRIVAENLARGLFSAEDAIERWMASSGHRQNLLDRRLRDTGFGVAVGEQEGDVVVVWVEDFAAER